MRINHPCTTAAPAQGPSSRHASSRIAGSVEEGEPPAELAEADREAAVAAAQLGVGLGVVSGRDRLQQLLGSAAALIMRIGS